MQYCQKGKNYCLYVYFEWTLCKILSSHNLNEITFSIINQLSVFDSSNRKMFEFTITLNLSNRSQVLSTSDRMFCAASYFHHILFTFDTFWNRTRSQYFRYGTRWKITGIKTKQFSLSTLSSSYLRTKRESHLLFFYKERLKYFSGKSPNSKRFRDHTWWNAVQSKGGPSNF